ncbi:uncharacterized protein [Dendrobates tinctorius]|uniref:uncharacterized protein n=1 Tax=Dendrobates tinctorius TaxID=92724 RepID=UPI003CC96BA3
MIMEARCLLLLILAIQEGSSDGKKGPYCTAQRGTIIVEEKGSVTIPCNFTYPQQDRSVEVRVYWRRGGNDRCGAREVIYNHTENWTHSNYTTRISMVGNPKEERTATITISNLKRSDRPTFCCRIHLYEGSEIIEQWQNRHGTFIQFKDEFSVEQTDVVPAFIGEDITIPCLFHHKGFPIIEEVTWTEGSSDLCVENNNKSTTWTTRNKSEISARWSVVNFPLVLSLRIRGVTTEDNNKQYCCKIKSKLRSSNTVNTLSSIHGTEVVVVDISNKPSFEVVQQYTISPDRDDSATINCSFTHQPGIDTLWMGVFWRVGSPKGIYAYHPLMEMVHSSYRGRTELRGLADLHIKEVSDTDNTTYYCFVMFKFCIANDKTSSSIQYGSETNLMVNGFHNQPDDHTWVYILIAAVPIIILCVVIIIFILKKRGHICKKPSRREDHKHMTSEIVLEEQIPSGNVQTPTVSSSAPPPPPQEDSAGILYAHLNVSSLLEKTRSRSKETMPDNDSLVVYAAVKPTHTHQNIYSTIDK